MAHHSSITFLDGSGDTTITWAEDVDEKMKAVIENLQKKGYTFLVINEYFGGKVKLSRKLKKMSQITNRSVVAQDDAISQLFDNGEIDIHSVERNTGKGIETVGVAKTIADIAGKSCVAVPRYQGG